MRILRVGNNHNPFAKRTAPPRGTLPAWRRNLVHRWTTWVFVVAGIFVIGYPFWPQIRYAIWLPADESLVPKLTASRPTDAGEFSGGALLIDRRAVPEGNRIIIPKIDVDMPILEGTNEKTSLDKGAWKMPSTSSPDQGGNTAITAHRYKNKPPSKETFYLLDKLEIGDTFTINWNGLAYKYQVKEVKVVKPTAVDVLNNTEQPVVTLITCTPLFTTKLRLVVVAQEVS